MSIVSLSMQWANTEQGAAIFVKRWMTTHVFKTTVVMNRSSTKRGFAMSSLALLFLAEVYRGVWFQLPMVAWHWRVRKHEVKACQAEGVSRRYSQCTTWSHGLPSRRCELGSWSLSTYTHRCTKCYLICYMKSSICISYSCCISVQLRDCCSHSCVDMRRCEVTAMR